MALMHIPLEQIQQQHLQSLIDAKAAETLCVEYKRDTYGSNDDARSEFLADISSFANTSGGDLVIGIDAKEGVPTAFNPFTGGADSELCRLDQMAQTGLEPRIPKLQMQAVPIASGGSVLIIRAARSYNAPHRVIFKGKNRFWARSSARKYEPNVDELREMITLAPRLAERMRDFRMERIARIAASDTPVPLFDERCLVLHVVPFSAFDLRPPFSLQSALARWHYFGPSAASAATYRINFDGLLTLRNSDTNTTKHRSYVQVFRTGAVEAVTSPVVQGQDHIVAQTLEALIVKSTRVYAPLLHECGAEPPLAVLVSLIGVKGRTLVPGFGYPEHAVIDRDQLHFVEVLLDEVPSGDPDCAKRLRQTLDQLANAAGRQSSASFDQFGNFTLGHGGYMP